MDRLFDRTCPICNHSISLEEYNGYYGWWNNKILAIPCCSCYEIMMYIQEATYIKLEQYPTPSEYKYNLEIFITREKFIEKKTNITFRINKNMLSRLQDCGII